jgi:mannose-1-phosphate guanylyltransferase/phosphomannomutase
MRTIVASAKDHEVVLVDGVKVLHGDGWALVLPDPEQPLTHVWAEGASDQEARQLAQEYARQIRTTLR